MTLRLGCIGAASAIALLGLAFAAQAAPLSGAGSGLKRDAAATSNVDTVAYRCRWRQGHRFCRWIEVSMVYDFAAAARAAASAVPMP